MTKGKNNDVAIRYASKPYTQIPDGLWVCPEFNALSPYSRCIFMVALSKWRWQEPDKPFVMLYEELRKVTRFTYSTISKSIKELQVAGFIDIPKRGCYPHNASLYKLDKRWIEQRYPKNPKPYPDYLIEILGKKKPA